MDVVRIPSSYFHVGATSATLSVLAPGDGVIAAGILAVSVDLRPPSPRGRRAVRRLIILSALGLARPVLAWGAASAVRDAREPAGCHGDGTGCGPHTGGAGGATHHRPPPRPRRRRPRRRRHRRRRPPTAAATTTTTTPARRRRPTPATTTTTPGATTTTTPPTTTRRCRRRHDDHGRSPSRRPRPRAAAARRHRVRARRRRRPTPTPARCSAGRVDRHRPAAADHVPRRRADHLRQRLGCVPRRLQPCAQGQRPHR